MVIPAGIALQCWGEKGGTVFSSKKLHVGVCALLVAGAAFVALVGHGASAPAKAQAAASISAAETNLRVVRMSFAQDGNLAKTSSTSYTDLPRATTTVNLPKAGHILATFTGESVCNGGNPMSVCSVRILVDGVEMRPQSGFDFAFDGVESENLGGLWESNSVSRVSELLPAGAHTVSVQFGVTNPAAEFDLDDWLLQALGTNG
jgi:hypothetical protein